MKKNIQNLLILIFITLLFSCEKTSESTSFVGKWVSQRTENDLTFKDNLTLTETSFDELVKLKLLPTIFIDILGAKGSLTYTSSTLLLKVETVGAAESDALGNFGQMQWYDINSDEYNKYIVQFGGGTINCKYEVDGNTMVLKMDLNADGVYSENDETNTYTRVN